MPSSHPCPSPPRLAHGAVAPLGAPFVLLKLPRGPGGHLQQQQRQEGRSRRLERDKLLTKPLLLQRLSVSCPLGCASGLFHSSSGWSLQEMLEVPALWCVIIQTSLS